MFCLHRHMVTMIRTMTTADNGQWLGHCNRELTNQKLVKLSPPIVGSKMTTKVNKVLQICHMSFLSFSIKSEADFILYFDGHNSKVLKYNLIFIDQLCWEKRKCGVFHACASPIINYGKDMMIQNHDTALSKTAFQYELNIINSIILHSNTSGNGRCEYRTVSLMNNRLCTVVLWCLFVQVIVLLIILSCWKYMCIAHCKTMQSIS